MTDATTRTLYILPCKCGNDAKVAPGQSGFAVVCRYCDTPLKVNSLRQLRRLPSIEQEIPTPDFRLQFRLAHLLLLFVPCAITSLLIEQIGLGPVIICISVMIGYLVAVYLTGLLVHNAGRILGQFWDSLEIRRDNHR